jgi:AcrR family transcriptional regulator
MTQTGIPAFLSDSLDGASLPRQATRRQSELLARLADLFRSEGFRHLTVDEIAGRLRCSKTSLYRLAPTKGDLVVKAMLWHQSQVEAWLDSELLDAKSASERLRRFVDCVRHLGERVSPSLIEDVATFAPTRQAWEQMGTRLTARLSGIVAAGIDTREFEPVSPIFVGFLIAYVSDAIRGGLASQVTGRPRDHLYDDLVDSVYRIVGVAGDRNKRESRNTTDPH